MHNPDFLIGLFLAQEGVSASSSEAVAVPGMPGAARTPNAATTGVPGAPAPALPNANPFGSQMWIILGGVMLFMILTSVMSGRKEKKRKAELLSDLKRQARVQTLGGIIGTVTEVNDDDVVIRLEEGRMRVSKSAIAAVLRDVPSKLEESAKTEIKPSREKAAI